MVEPSPRFHSTYGEWASESEACAALDEIIAGLDMFEAHHEVRGYYLQPRLDQELKTPRIDRILIPNERLISKGWNHGPIGIECKRSGVATGPPLAQLLDYSRAVWKVGDQHIMPRWFFLWPMQKACGPIASIMAQHRIGSANSYENWQGWGYALKLSCGENVLATFDWHGSVRINDGKHGRKAGSR